MHKDLSALKTKIIQSIKSCDDIEVLNNIIRSLENSSKVSESETVYKTDLNIERELNKGLEDFKAGRTHKHEDALKILDRLIK